MYQSSNYAWQPGYWQTFRPGLIWTPAYYMWMPGGYLFVPGYWDWPLANRGLLFAPVVFNQPLWTTPGWFYQPSYAVPYPGLLSSLFLGPNGGGYYFGNYFGPSYCRLGFRPWYASGGLYNPLFSWYRWRNLNNPNWLNGLYATYRGRYNGSLPLPPLTFNRNNLHALQTVQPINQLSGMRLARLSGAQLIEQRNLASRLQQFSRERQALRSLALSRLPGPALAPAVRANPAPAVSHRPINPVGASVAGHLEPRILTTHHTPAAIAAPRIVHPVPHTPVVTHHQAPIIHSTPAPAHHPAALPHFNPPAHHAAPPAHHFAPAAHHFAPPGHAGGGHGGHHR
jgi:hypothetical protein